MPFGLYLHFPFCPYKCSYCDFYKELFDAGLQQRFFEGLTIETELAAESAAADSFDNEISTIFIGGGTPSMVDLEQFGRWFEHFKKFFVVPDGIEFSFENNPDSVSVEQLQAIKELGITRPTFGIQSFNARLLRLLNRPHKPEDSQKAAYLANALGFQTYGVDLIFGLPKQTTAMLSADIDQLMDISPPHISFYQLTVEQNTRLYDKVTSGALTVPDADTMLAMYRSGCERFVEAGYTRYEVSSFAKPGHECAHNIGYWEGRDYLGLGPSAHSFMNGRRFANTPDIVEYTKTLRMGKRPLVPDESGIEDRMTEAIMLGLRTSRGINRSHFTTRFGASIEDRFDRSQYDIFIQSGHLIPDGGVLRLSDDGIYLADEITRRLLK